MIFSSSIASIILMKELEIALGPILSVFFLLIQNNLDVLISVGIHLLVKYSFNNAVFFQLKLA